MDFRIKIMILILASQKEATQVQCIYCTVNFQLFLVAMSNACSVDLLPSALSFLQFLLLAYDGS